MHHLGGGDSTFGSVTRRRTGRTRHHWHSYGYSGSSQIVEKMVFEQTRENRNRENRRVFAGDLWWAWVDLNHRPRPYQGCVIRFYKNLQDRGDCQSTQVVQDIAFCGLGCGLEIRPIKGGIASEVAVTPVVTHISSDSHPRFAVDPRSLPFQLSGQSEEHSVFAEST